MAKAMTSANKSSKQTLPARYRDSLSAPKLAARTSPAEEARVCPREGGICRFSALRGEVAESCYPCCTTERNERFLHSLQPALQGGGRCKLARKLVPRLTMYYYIAALRGKVRTFSSTAPARDKTTNDKELGTLCLSDIVLLLNAL